MKYVSKKPRIGELREPRTGSYKKYVVPVSKGWAVQAEVGSTPRKIYRTQAAAVRAAHGMIRDTGGEVIVKGRDGRFRDSFTIGRVGFEKVSAVEGIRLTLGVKQALKEFDRKRLSPAQRRSAIMRKYGGKQP